MDKQYNGHTKKDKRTNNTMDTLKKTKINQKGSCPDVNRKQIQWRGQMKKDKRANNDLQHTSASMV